MGSRAPAWCPSGFSVFADQLVPPEETDRLEHLARYIARPPIRIDTVEQRPDGKLSVTTPREHHLRSRRSRYASCVPT